MASRATLVRRACAVASLVVLPVAVAVLIAGAAPSLPEVELGGLRWDPTSGSYGMLPLIAGTVLSSALAIAVAAPLGLLAAIHLSEFAAPGRRERLSALFELVALVPTLVWGYFALVVLSPRLAQIVPSLADESALSAGLVLGVMLTPMIAAHASAALAAVPRRLREGALALGAGEAQTILTIVIPAAAPGIAAAILLALSRALGETMIVTLAAGHRPTLTLDPRVPIETMSSHILEATRTRGPDHPLFAVALALLVLCVFSSLIARRVAQHRPEEGRR